MSSPRKPLIFHPDPFDSAPIAAHIWDLKYRLKAGDGAVIDSTIDDTWRRIARALASVERGGKRAQEGWAGKFHAALADFGFLPAGRIIAGAGTARDVTLFNCFVMGRIEDDLSAIFGAVKEAALTMQQGGGIGQDFSTLRPKGALVRSIGADASGPVSFMDVWDAMCRTIKSAGARRGAMMATLRCDHPDIEDFIAAKSDPTRLRNFNLSVLITDAFMKAVAADVPWQLAFDGKVYKTLQARALWEKITRATYEYAEPGVVFIDRINAANNLAYCEDIAATNPCGEQPLPPYGACLLGSINLARFVDRPFDRDAGIDETRLAERVRLAVRMLDNAIDLSNYPLEAQRKEAKAKRRIGLGITGLADALIFCGLRYDSAEAVARAGAWMAKVERAAYLASAELAKEKGAFPLFDAEKFQTRPNVQRLEPEVRGAIAKHGIRNGCLTSIAPTGTISLLAGNVSSGIEPVFDFRYRRRILGDDGSATQLEVEDYAHALHRRRFGEVARHGPAFVTAGDLAPSAHIAMQAAIQRHVDSSISKTINCPADMPFDDFRNVYALAYAHGLKGCTTFRPNAITGAVLTSLDGSSVAPTALQSVTTPERGARQDLEAGDARPLERDPALAGFTYKLKWPPSDHAIYVTINDIERDGARRPFEVFINTKNLEHYAWTVALTRMISAVFRRGGDVTFVVEELKAVFDPQGGQWIGGRYVPSLLAAIGGVIEMHMIRIGFLPTGQHAAGGGGGSGSSLTGPATGGGASPLGFGIGTAGARVQGSSSSRQNEPSTGIGSAPAAVGPAIPARACPRCSQLALIREEGCWVCLECGFSRCN